VKRLKKIEKISSFQFFILVIMFVVGSSVLYIPSVLAASAKEDAWIVGVIGGFLGVGIVFLYIKMAEASQGKDLIQMYDSVFGSILGKVFTIIFCFYCLIIASLILRGIGDFMFTQIMPETPIEIIMGLFIFLVIHAQKYGVEVFARTAEIFFPWIIFLFTFGVCMILRDIEFVRIFPILSNGIKPILKGTFSYFGFPYLECLLLLMLLPYCNHLKSAKKSWILGTIAGAIILLIIIVLSIMVLGPEMTARQSYVTYILAKKMGIPHVFERMEVIIAIFWILTIFYKLLICSFCLTKSIGTLLKVEEEKILAFPLGIIIFCTAIISGEDVVYLNDFSSKIWPFVALQIGLLLPLLILLIQKGKKRIKQKGQFNN
jgi:spore germination protein KB